MISASGPEPNKRELVRMSAIGGIDRTWLASASSAGFDPQETSHPKDATIFVVPRV
jgi:hypothetical protein